MQSDPLTTGELIVTVVSLTAFTGAVGFCLSNAIRFWRLRTYHMGLFYVMALLNLLSRCAYFVLRFFKQGTYANFLLDIGPGVLDAGIIISQIMIYLIFHTEVSFYLQNRDEIVKSIEIKANRCSCIIQTVATGVIILICGFFATEMWINASEYRQHSYTYWWTYYQFQLGILNILCFALLLFTTVQVLKSIKALSGNTSTTGVYVAIIVFCTMQAIKVASTVTIYLIGGDLIQFLAQNTIWAMASEAALWMTFDLTPLIVLFWIHR